MFSAWTIQFQDFARRHHRDFRYVCPGCRQGRARNGSPRRRLAMMALLMSAQSALATEQDGFDRQALIDRQLLVDEQQLVRDQKLIDPTRPAGWKQKSADSYSPQQRPAVRVDYIIHSRQRKVVSINGDHLQEGDRWRDIRIIRIEPKKVLLAWRGQQWFNSINPNEGNNRNSMVIRRSK